MSRQLRREEYTVGWVCALPIELAAAQEMLDEEHENLHHDPDDTNIYTLGRIGEHNVVIACLPEGQTGTNSAAAVAVQMKSAFKSIRFGLMVGIGGGVPSEEADIRLGDVVVSRPHKIHGGVVQYDFGKATPSGFERTGFLNTPPTILLNALANLQANHVRGKSRLLEYVSKLDRLPTFTHGDAGPDILFEASYNHKGGATCGDYSKEKVVARQTRRQEIAIHYGTIASGNQVMRDAAERDRVSAELGGVLCFEMEAAGLMNSFPCLVIRGICDYADSHKNKRWQAFAAGTAAAYTKEVLSVIPPADVAKTRPHSADLTEFSKSFSLAEYDRQIAKLPYAEDAAFDSMLWEQKPQCLPGTRVLLRRQVEAWSKDPHLTPIFWLKGMAGTGKSTIARTVSRSFAEQKRLGASFFFSKGRGDLGNAKKFITTIATQLAGTIPSLRRHISGVMSENPQIIRRGLTEQWKDLVLQPLSSLTDAVLQARSFVIVIDALDECDSEDDVRLVLRLLAETKAIKGTLLRIFITSRPETPIRLGFRKMPEDAYQDFALHDVDEAIIQHDISLFLSCELENIRKDHNIDQGWPSKHSTELLAQHAKGLFIYAATACRFIRNSKPFAPEDRLSLLLQGSTASKSPAAELDRIYSQILQYCVIGDSDSQEKGELARKFKEVVGSIVVLYDTLDSAALAELIDVPEQRIFAVLGDLHSVLDVPGNGDHPIQLLHPSFRDFLLDPGRCTDTDFRVQEKSIHQALYFRCVKLLSKHLKRDICDLKRPGTLAAEVGKVEVNKHISSQVQYACRYWVDHLKHSGIALYDNDEAHVFLQQHFLHWLETLSLIGGMSEVVLMVRILESILINERDTASGFLSILQDAKRFVLSYRGIIEITPLQIYCSALIFSPIMSHIRQQFWDQRPLWIKRQPQAQENWGSFLQALEGHLKAVNSVAFSPDGQLVASGSADNTVRLWDAATGSSRGTLEGHSNVVWSVAFSPDGQLVASASADSTIRLWNVVTRIARSTLEGHSDSVYSVTFSPDGQLVASGSYDNTIRLWDAVTGTARNTLKGHSNLVRSVAFSSDGLLVASGSGDKTVRLWDAATGLSRDTLEGHSNMVWSVAFSPDGQLVASGSDDNTVRLWDAATGESRDTLKGHANPVYSVAFSPGGQLVASGSGDSTVRLWDAATGTARGTLKGHWGSVISVAFSPDGQLVATASGDKTVRLWDSVAFSLDGQLVASASGGETARIWDAATEAVRGTFRGFSGWVYSVAFSPDGQLVASGSHDDTVRLWDAATGATRDALEGHLGSVLSVAFSPNGQLVASRSLDNTIRLWDAVTGAARSTLEGHSELVCSMAFSPDGQLVASGSGDETVRLWDAATGATRGTLEGHSNLVYSVAFSPDGQLIASGSWDGTVRLWNVVTGAARITFQGHSGFVNSVTFSPNSQMIASASNDNTVKLWDVITGAVRGTLEGHSNMVNSVAFSSNGQVIASASDDETVRLWDAVTGAARATLNVDVVIRDLSFSASGQYLKTDRGVLDISSLFTNATARSSRCLRTLFVSNNWVAEDGENILWLPPDYRATCVTVWNGIVVLGHTSGDISFLEFGLGNKTL